MSRKREHPDLTSDTSENSGNRITKQEEVHAVFMNKTEAYLKMLKNRLASTEQDTKCTLCSKVFKGILCNLHHFLRDHSTILLGIAVRRCKDDEIQVVNPFSRCDTCRISFEDQQLCYIHLIIHHLSALHPFVGDFLQVGDSYKCELLFEGLSDTLKVFYHFDNGPCECETDSDMPRENACKVRYTSFNETYRTKRNFVWKINKQGALPDTEEQKLKNRRIGKLMDDFN